MRKSSAEYLKEATDEAHKVGFTPQDIEFWMFTAQALSKQCYFLEERCALFESLYREEVGAKESTSDKGYQQ